jgi:hypothetical protein
MKRFLLPIIFLVVLTVYGIAEGLWTNRLFPSEDLERAASRVSRVPRTVGDWEGTDQELDARQVARAEMTAYVSRRYVNSRTGAAVNMLLVCGRPGPTSLHSPDICYAGAGYQAAGPPVRKPIARKAEDPLGDFWVGQFRKAGPVPEALQIFWAWNGAGTWQAADRPRFQFAHHAALYKLYVVRQLPRADEPAAEDPAADFLAHFLPELQRALFDVATAAGEQGRGKS